MDGSHYDTLMQSVFRPFLEEMGFAMQPVHVSSRYYRASFVGQQHTVYVSFEPGDAQATVMLATNGYGDLRSIDDPMKTPRLSHLNARYMDLVSEVERRENEQFFGRHIPRDNVERRLIKCAKDLRLVLARHLAT